MPSRYVSDVSASVNAERAGHQKPDDKDSQRRRSRNKRDQHRRDHHARGAKRPGQRRSDMPGPEAVEPQLMHDDGGHQEQCHGQNHGDPGAGDITCRQPLAGACDGQLPCRNDETDEEGKQHEPQPAVDGLPSRRGEQPHQRGDARMLRMP
jgi:hypothetical protein